MINPLRYFPFFAILAALDFPGFHVHHIFARLLLSFYLRVNQRVVKGKTSTTFPVVVEDIFVPHIVDNRPFTLYQAQYKGKEMT